MDRQYLNCTHQMMVESSISTITSLSLSSPGQYGLPQTASNSTRFKLETWAKLIPSPILIILSTLQTEFSLSISIQSEQTKTPRLTSTTSNSNDQFSFLPIDCTNNIPNTMNRVKSENSVVLILKDSQTEMILTSTRETTDKLAKSLSAGELLMTQQKKSPLAIPLTAISSDFAFTQLQARQKVQMLKAPRRITLQLLILFSPKELLWHKVVEIRMAKVMARMSPQDILQNTRPEAFVYQKLQWVGKMEFAGMMLNIFHEWYS